MTCESPALLEDRAPKDSDGEIKAPRLSFYPGTGRWCAFSQWDRRRQDADLSWFGRDPTRAYGRFRNLEVLVRSKPFTPDPAEAGVLDRKLDPGARSAFMRLHRRMADLADQGRQTPCELAPEMYCSDDPADLLEASLACGWCPVRRECGDYADRAGERHLVWGGRVRDPGKAAAVEKLRAAEAAS